MVGQDIQFSLRAEIYPLTDPGERKDLIDTRFLIPGTRIVALGADEKKMKIKMRKKILTRTADSVVTPASVGSWIMIKLAFHVFLHPTTEPLVMRD